MKTKIESYYKKDARKAAYHIKKDVDLWKWVLANCDPQSYNTNTTIYTAYSGEKLLCPCGSGKLRKCQRFNTGLDFCGLPKTCSAAMKSVTEKCKNLVYDKEKALEKRKKTNFIKYGYESSFESEIVKDKIKATNLIKYGAKNPNQSKIVRDKIDATNLERYGVVNPQQNKQVQDKTKATNLIKYGSESSAASVIIRNKIANTNIIKYGSTSPFSSKEVQQKSKETNLIRFGYEYALSSKEIHDRIKITNIEKYGVEHPFQNEEIRQKYQNTCFKKYGVFYGSQINFSELAKEYLFDPTKLKELLLRTSVNEASNFLGVSSFTIHKAHKKYNLNIISPYSSYETALAFWLTKNNINFIPNTKKIISPLELDFYLPEYNLAIEFDGLYWHSESAGKDKNYHLNKTKLCKDQNIRLVHIFEDEWMDKKEICLDILSRILGINQQKIYARKCIIKELSNNECKEFLNNNHLQGYTSATINLGVYYKNELVQLLTFKHSRYNKKIEWENIRQCNKIGFQIIGGLQKLWKYFLKKYNPKSVVSYCDLRWFVGNSYSSLSFSLDHISGPQYWYIKRIKRFHRSLFIKKHCIKYAMEITNLTEEELSKFTEKYIAKEILKLEKIWDCGQQTWYWYQK